ncbi:MAG: tRNA pseudouridine(55) synthase TruB [Bdellovibrionota bacterium]
MKSGLVLVHKQSGMTSFDCVRNLKRLWKRTDIGHGGTLDKFATGVLPILMGEGLKLARFFLDSYPNLATHWKTYEGVFELGISTSTGDPEGEATEKADVPALTESKITDAMSEFVGSPYLQTPPQYSAKKVGGERASDLARQGKVSELKPVPVLLKRFHCLKFEGNRIYFEVECSKGTYVRVLAQDLAEKLGTKAHVAELRRTSVGNFALDRALTLEQIAALDPDQAILGLEVATSFLEPFPLIGSELEQLKVGRTMNLSTRLANAGLKPSVYCAKTYSNGREVPVALLELDLEKNAKFLRAFVV